MSETILVTGASGFLASHIILAFLEAGYKIRGTVRSNSTAEKVKSRYPRDNEKDLLQLATQGTLNITKAVAEREPNVRRVIVTASFASMLDLDQAFRPGYRYTEADWNPCTYETAHNKPPFSVTTICPPWIFGPTIDDGLTKVNESTETIWNLINGSLKDVFDNDFAAFVNIHDAAEAHLKAYETEKAANQRFLVAGGRFLKQEACDIIRRRFRAKEVLGIEYRSLEDTLIESVQDLLRKHSA
ncbi:hypothetical protein BJX64DRAFT_279357 [Aspergillus heterothallicus]